MEGPQLTHTKITIGTATILKVAAVIAFCWLAFYLFDIVLVVLASVVIASSIEPVVKWFIERKVPRTVAVLAIYVSVSVLFVGAFYFLIIPLFTELQSFTANLPAYTSSLTNAPIGGEIPGIGSVNGLIHNLPIAELATKVNTMVITLSQNAFTTASVILGGLLNFILIVVLSFYLSVQSGGIANFLRIIIPSNQRRYVIGLWNRAEEKIGLWLQGQFLLGVIVAVLTFLGLTLIGVKHAILLGFMAGVLELIPLFGPFLAAIPAVMFGYSDGGVTTAFIVAGFYLIVQQFESQLIYPLVVKKVVGVPPIISILALVVGAKLAGFLGLLIAVPVAAILMEFFHDLERDRAEEERVK